jgi:uncharacterized FlaG/YvyC family protein
MYRQKPGRSLGECGSELFSGRLKKMFRTADKVFRQDMSEVLPVTAITEPASAASLSVVPSGPERALVREVSKAVEQLNEAGFAGQGNEITFSIDRATRLLVVKLVNTDTKDVLSQWPAQYVLQLAADNAESARDSR